ncbi:MAG: hypothetical protein AAGE52_35080 [Myxococcota bacterium]
MRFCARLTFAVAVAGCAPGREVTPVSDPVVPSLSQVRRVEWTALSSVPYVHGEPLPDDVRALDGLEVIIQGHMIRIDDGFLLMKEWRGHNGPELHEAVVVSAPTWHPTLLMCQVTVRGTLSVGPRAGEYTEVSSLYRLQATSIEVHVDDSLPECASVRSWYEEGRAD